MPDWRRRLPDDMAERDGNPLPLHPLSALREITIGSAERRIKVLISMAMPAPAIQMPSGGLHGHWRYSLEIFQKINNLE